MGPSIALITFTRNSARELRRLLTQVAPLVDEIVVVDGFSTDNTIEVAKSFGAKVYSRKPWGYVEPDRMFALRNVVSDWVLYLDVDELLSPRFRRDLRRIVEDVHDNAEVGAFRVKRVEVGRDLKPYWISHQIRLFRRDRVLYKGLVHELPEVKGRLVELPLEYYIIHLTDFPRFNLRKQLLYAKLEALEYYKRPTGSRTRRVLRKISPLSFPAFVLYYILASFRQRCLTLGALRYSVHAALYETFASTYMKSRTGKERNIARVVQNVGLIQLLHLD